MVATAAAASAAISTVEKASVILTIISAAIQVAMAIVNLFNDDASKQKEIENLQNRIDQLQWELDNADTSRLMAKTGSAVERVRKTYMETKNEVFELHKAVLETEGFIVRMYHKMTLEGEIVQKSVAKIADEYGRLSYTVDKAMGEERFASSREMLENIAEQQLLINKQIDAERDKKKTDYDQIEEWERKIEELGQEAVNIINEMVEDIIGDSAEDIAGELADAFYEAFEAGEDAAQAWGDKVNEIVADVIKRMLVSKYLEEPLGEIFDRYKAKWFKEGRFQGLDAVIESMSSFASDLNQVGREFAEIWDNLPDSVKNMFTVTADAEDREASQRGIANASQESVDELNGARRQFRDTHSQ